MPDRRPTTAPKTADTSTAPMMKRTGFTSSTDRMASSVPARVTRSRKNGEAPTAASIPNIAPTIAPSLPGKTIRSRSEAGSTGAISSSTITTTAGTATDGCSTGMTVEGAGEGRSEGADGGSRL